MQKPVERKKEQAAKADAAPASVENPYAVADPALFAQNMIKVGVQSQRLIADFLKRQMTKAGSEPLDPLNLRGTFSAFLRAMTQNPVPLIEAQFEFWKSAMGLWESTARRMLGENGAPSVEPKAWDRRFKDREWQENQVFDFIKQSYLLTANWIQSTVGKVELDDREIRHRVDFYTKQFVDAMAPTNFVLTNPEVLRTTLQSSGDNLVKGLDNLLEDIERGGGELAIRQSADAFTPEIGRASCRERV